MSDQPQSATTPASTDEKFSWHPVYSGKSFAQVHDALAQDIARDQRSYQLAMDAAEGAEHDSLSTIVELERRWSVYQFDWADTDPKRLADRILKFERACENRKEAMSIADYRASGALVEADESPRPETTRSLPIMQIGGAILAILIIFFIIAVLT
ncbi:MAG: hypothetical protein H0T72_04810 [Chloroflexia bacterium]|nr:hypothetical protein [Chloroflexia bacterium]